jgi:hypothetical protein
MANIRASRISRGNRGTSSRDLSEHATGYTANGEGEYTRRSAQGNQTNSGRPPDLRGKRLPLELIAEQEWKLKHLRAELCLEDNPTRRKKLEANIEIKRTFLATLRGELAPQNSGAGRHSTSTTRGSRERADRATKGRVNESNAAERASWARFPDPAATRAPGRVIARPRTALEARRNKKGMNGGSSHHVHPASVSRITHKKLIRQGNFNSI